MMFSAIPPLATNNAAAGATDLAASPSSTQPPWIKWAMGNKDSSPDANGKTVKSSWMSNKKYWLYIVGGTILVVAIAYWGSSNTSSESASKGSIDNDTNRSKSLANSNLVETQDTSCGKRPRRSYTISSTDSTDDSGYDSSTSTRSSSYRSSSYVSSTTSEDTSSSSSTRQAPPRPSAVKSKNNTTNNTTGKSSTSNQTANVAANVASTSNVTPKESTTTVVATSDSKRRSSNH